MKSVEVNALLLVGEEASLSIIATLERRVRANGLIENRGLSATFRSLRDGANFPIVTDPFSP
jgi:hypothetical protein